MSQRKEYIDKMAEKLKDLDAEIDSMETKINRMQDKARRKYLINIQELRLKKQQLQNKLENIRLSGEEAWKEMKSGMDKSWDILKSSAEQAFSKFNS